MDASTSGGGAPPRSASEEGGRQQRSAPRPPPSFRGAPDDTVPPQLAQSRALNSEGLEVRVRRWEARACCLHRTKLAHAAPSGRILPADQRSRPNAPPLQGFIPRAIELVKLGGSFIFAFAPFMIAVSPAPSCTPISASHCRLPLALEVGVLHTLSRRPPTGLPLAQFWPQVALGFGAVYFVFGDAFIHGGSPASGPPPYIDPDMLLAEPTADPMVSLRCRRGGAGPG